MERQYRHAVKEVLTEIPAGIVEEGEDRLTAAKRELQEETGYAGGDRTLLTVEYAQGGVQDRYFLSAKETVSCRSSKVFPLLYPSSTGNISLL